MRRPKPLLAQATDTLPELVCYYGTALALGSLSYAHFEHKHVSDGVWWAVVTSMTVGYGDQYPVTLGGRVTAGILMFVTVFLIIPLIIARVIKKAG